MGLLTRDDETGFAPGVYDPDKDVWGLYYLPEDFSPAKNLAAEHPDKLEELQDPFWQEAERNRVLPLLGGMAVFFGDLPPMPTVTRFSFKGDVQNVQRGMIPRILSRSYAIGAHLHVPDGFAEGVIVANAHFIGGTPCGLTRKAYCTTPIRSSVWRPTNRFPRNRSRPAT